MFRNRPILFYIVRVASKLSVLLLVLLAGSLALRLYARWAGSASVSKSIDGTANSGQPLSAIFTPEVLHWRPLISAWALAYNVDPNLIATVIQIESCGDPYVVSPSGAQGLFQVMPSHFSAGEDMLEVLNNGRHGMEYLAQGLEIALGDPGLALAGYNGGHGVISGGWAHWSAETRRYYQWGVGIYDDASKNRPTSPTIQEWLKAGGDRLCQRASQEQLIARR